MKPDPASDKATAAAKTSPRAKRGMIGLGLGAFAGAALISAIVGVSAVRVIESRSARNVSDALAREGLSWARVETDGLKVVLSGIAPNEAARFRALNLAANQVDSSRVVDQLDVTPAMAFDAPDFSVEMLRNEDGIQLIGLLPSAEDEKRLVDIAEKLMPGAEPAKMLETASYPLPSTWSSAFSFGLEALELLPRSKISVDAERVNITASAASAEEKRHFEGQLSRRRPANVDVNIQISAPRPVLTPFTLRFVKDGEGARFDACSADTDTSRRRILAAARLAGLSDQAECTVGLGVPSPSWANAVEAAIKAVNRLGNGIVTFSDADLTLLAGEDVSQANFDRVVGDLQAELPQVFSLNATLAKKQIESPAGPAEFTAELSAKTGRVELRGRLSDQMQREAVSSFARAHFGVGKVYSATRLDPELPVGWPVRVLAALEALAELNEGTVLVRNDLVEIKGVTGNRAARDRISQILSDKLGQGQSFRVNIRYDKALDPQAALPTPQECHDNIAAILARDKIAFAPGSAEIEGKSSAIMTKISDILRKCSAIRMEVAGYTDSQGSDQGNLALSQARAEAVLLNLQGRGVDVSWLRARGYGEADPVADNSTEDGREKNRRIEFTLLETARPKADNDAATAAATGVASAAAAGAAAGTSAGTSAGAAVGAATASAQAEAGAGASPARACRQAIINILAQKQITFEPGSDVITSESNDVMARIAAELKSCPGVAMEVSGHTDSQGSLGGNQRLSQSRANSVLVALAKLGVDVDRMKAVGYGEANPIADNGSEEGREKNRRIEFFLITAQGQATDPEQTQVPQADEANATGAGATEPDEPTAGDTAAQEPEAGTPETGTPQTGTPETGTGQAETAGTGQAETGAADVSDDDSASLAPQEKTQKPQPRPATLPSSAPARNG